MDKIKIINQVLLSNKKVDEVCKLPLWLVIIFFITSVFLTSLPMIIQSNATIERIFQNQSSVVFSLENVFDESRDCGVVSGQLTGCGEEEIILEELVVGIGKEMSDISTVSFLNETLEIKLGTDQEIYQFKMSYPFDFSFNQVEEKKIITYQWVNQWIQSSQFSNIINILLIIGVQCIFYIFIGMVSFNLSSKAKKKKKYSWKELFKIQSMLSLSGAVIAFIFCFIVDPLVAFAPTIFLFNIIIRNFDVSLKM